jgi:2-dehydro-3-deoxyphosphooctonate aldolase (KDO 8-P synthase)
MRSLEIMKSANVPVILDCTHAVQEPGGMGDRSGGNREMAKVLARAGTAVGIAGLFLEVHNDPDNAPSDGPNMIHLHDLYTLLSTCFDIDSIIKKNYSKK